MFNVISSKNFEKSGIYIIRKSNLIGKLRNCRKFPSLGNVISSENFENVGHLHYWRIEPHRKLRNGREFPSLEKGSSLKLFGTAKIVLCGWWKKLNISISNAEIVFHHPDSLVRRHPIWLTLFSVNSCNQCCGSELDPDPPDPHVFGPPGSRSNSQRYGSRSGSCSGSGSGSFYHHAKIVRKTLIPTI
jgi:hypothetical protein